MVEQGLFAIGHITNNLEPTPHLGGAALPTLDRVQEFIAVNPQTLLDPDR